MAFNYKILNKDRLGTGGIGPFSLAVTGSFMAFASVALGDVPPTDPTKIPEVRPGVLTGYMSAPTIDSVALLPPPPEDGSPAAAADEAARQEAQKYRDTPQWDLATRDSPYRDASVVDTFACALGIKIDEETTPHLNILMRRTLADFGLASDDAKRHYNRKRPFLVANDGICEVGEEDHYINNASYPSGHSAFGWGWGLMLTQIAPDRAGALIKRGYEFGQNRVVCNLHWQSDVDAGRIVGSAVFAQIQSVPEYQAQVAEARREYQEAVTANSKPDCELEEQVAQGD